jgi:TPR repeat protein
MYLAGRGALQNFESAYEWFEKAAQQNHAESQYRLGIMYRSGHAVPLDKARAYFWFNLAAAQGHERAAEARDNLLSALTSEQIARVQREAQAWKPTPAPN